MVQKKSKAKDSQDKEFLTLLDVAKYLGVNIDTIYSYINSGGKPLPSMRLSRKKILVEKKDLDKWMDEKKETDKLVRMSSGDRKTMYDNMQKYGGSFVVALSECFLRADSNNFAKLCVTFSEYVTKYLYQGEKK